MHIIILTLTALPLVSMLALIATTFILSRKDAKDNGM